MVSYKLLLAVALPLRVVQAFVEAGAYINGCVYFAKKPTSPIGINFQVGVDGTQCMDSNGTSGSFSVTDAGVTCYSMGYVKSKGSSTGGDNCAVRNSTWAVSYNTTMSQSGYTSSYWSANYQGRLRCGMNLQGSDGVTNVCDSANLCINREYDWSYSTTPTYYPATGQSPSATDGKPCTETITETVTITTTNFDCTSSGARNDPLFDQIVLVE